MRKRNCGLSIIIEERRKTNSPILFLRKIQNISQSDLFNLLAPCRVVTGIFKLPSRESWALESEKPDV